jgi:hypothetical protein
MFRIATILASFGLILGLAGTALGIAGDRTTFDPGAILLGASMIAFAILAAKRPAE